jgi:hypothetical protein
MSQCVIPFQRIVSFTVLLLGLPQIIFLGFQQKSAQDNAVCFLPQGIDYGECSNIVSDIQFSATTLELARSLKFWITAQIIATLLTCLVAVVGLTALVCKQRA